MRPRRCACSLLRGEPSVDDERRAGCEVGAVAREVEQRVGDLVGPPDPLRERMLLADDRVREGIGPALLAEMVPPIGVRIVPGATALMRIPSGAYSSAADLVRPSTPNLEAA
jgi:hypothetical protein